MKKLKMTASQAMTFEEAKCQEMLIYGISVLGYDEFPVFNRCQTAEPDQHQNQRP